MRFSIIVVCLNPGDKLNQTLDSILSQTCNDYEVVVKDGGSRDGSVEAMRSDARICFYQEKDGGIYEAMNQAVAHAEGDFVLFLNCGDFFPDEKVLEQTSAYIDREAAQGTDLSRLVLYGDTLGEKNGVVIASPSRIDGFVCYRNIPCHQACFYSRRLCADKPYDPAYRIRADYDHFLWCYYRAGAKFVHMDLAAASYEGGGFSESKANRKRDRQEHRQITESYMRKGELFKYKAVMACTLAPLRSAMAESSAFSGIYHEWKRLIYRR
ncbi:MAG: glycosyltransferase [Blautia sp.]|nr:glycosyltransferase [Blautia sp.]